MSDFDAYEDDMRLLPRDRDIDRVFSGTTNGDDLEDLARAFEDIRTTFSAPPELGVRSSHLFHVSEEAAALRLGTTGARAQEKAGARIRPRRTFARLAVVAALLMGLTTGLAFAGVDVPARVGDALEWLGVDVTDEDGRARADGRVPDEALDETPPKERDCEFGKAVSQTVGRPAGTADDRCSREGRSHENNDRAGDAEGLSNRRAEGRNAAGGSASGGHDAPRANPPASGSPDAPPATPPADPGDTPPQPPADDRSGGRGEQGRTVEDTPATDRPQSGGGSGDVPSGGPSDGAGDARSVAPVPGDRP